MTLVIINIAQKYNLVLIRRVMAIDSAGDFHTEKLTERTYIAKMENSLIYVVNKNNATNFSLPEANKLVKDFFPDARKDEDSDIWRFSKAKMSDLKKDGKYMVMEIGIEKALEKKDGNSMR